MSREIVLVNNRGIALVDDEDFDRLSQFRWYILAHMKKGKRTHYASRVIYGSRREDRRTVMMHQDVLGVCSSRKFPIDHIDENGLNNTRTNLEQKSVNKNALRASAVYGAVPFRGVCSRGNGKYRAEITILEQPHSMGEYHSAEEASRIYQEARDIFLKSGEEAFYHYRASLNLRNGSGGPGWKYKKPKNMPLLRFPVPVEGVA